MSIKDQVNFFIDRFEMADVICCMLRRGEKLNVHSLRLYNIFIKLFAKKLQK